MRIELNGEAMDIRAARLDALLEECGYCDKRLATAVNGEIVHREDRATTELREHDRVEVLGPVVGG